MSENTYVPSFVDGSGQLRLEVRYRGEGDPPWCTGYNVNVPLMDRVLQAVRGVEGVIRVHQGHCTSLTLRLWVDTRRGADLDSIKAEIWRVTHRAVTGQ